jgi:hypothetical protein
MGAWYLSIGLSLVLILVGLYTHWLVILFAVLLPVVPILTLLARRRLARRPNSREEPPGA